MPDQDSDPAPLGSWRRELYERSLQAREFEIELLWRRSAFFWAFTSVAFAGFAVAAADGHFMLASLVSCFGAFSSVAWTLVNRGSKYWFDVWEKRTEKYEAFVTGPLFRSAYPDVRAEDANAYVQAVRRFLGAKRFSVSTAVIAISDYTVSVWIAGAIYSAVGVVAPDRLSDFRLWGLLSFVTWTAVAVAVAVVGVSRPEEAPEGVDSWTDELPRDDPRKFEGRPFD